MAAKPIGTLGNVETLTISGKEFVNIPNLIAITAYVGAGTYATARLGTTGAGYAVTGGKTLQISAVRAVWDGSAVQGAVVGYCDNDIGVNSPTVPSNPVYFMGYNGATSTRGVISTLQPAYVYETSMFFNIPAGKYLFINCLASVNGYVTFFGYEV